MGSTVVRGKNRVVISNYLLIFANRKLTTRLWLMSYKLGMINSYTRRRIPDEVVPQQLYFLCITVTSYLRLVVMPEKL